MIPLRLDDVRRLTPGDLRTTDSTEITGVTIDSRRFGSRLPCAVSEVARSGERSDPPYQPGAIEQRRVTLIRHDDDVELAPPCHHGIQRSLDQHRRIAAANNHDREMRQCVEFVPQRLRGKLRIEWSDE